MTDPRTECINPSDERRMVKFNQDGKPLLLDVSKITKVRDGGADSFLAALGVWWDGNGSSIYVDEGGQEMVYWVDEKVDEVMAALNKAWLSMRPRQ